MDTNNKNDALKSIESFLICLIILLLAACGGGDSSDGDGQLVADNIANSITVSQNTILINGVDQVVQISAQVSNKDGERLDKSVVWESDNPSVISVDESGKLTSLQSEGHANIYAMHEALRSKPVKVSVASLTAGSQILNGNQLLLEPKLENPSLPPSQSNRYVVTVGKDYAVSVGDKIVSAENSYVGGEVVEIQKGENTNKLIVAVSPLNTIFNKLEANENTKLENLSEYIAPGIAEQYSVETKDDGSIVLTLKPKTNNKPQANEKTRGKITARDDHNEAETYALSGMECLYNTEFNVFPIVLNNLPDSITINPDLDFTFDYDLENGGLQKLVLDGTIDVSFELDLGIQAEIDGFIECEQELFVVTPPLPGVFSAMIPVGIPISMGFRVDGNIQTQIASINSSTSVTSNINMGIVCDTAGCNTITNGSAQVNANIGLRLSDKQDLLENLKLQFTKMPYATAGLRIYGLNLISYRAGIAETHNFADITTQIALPDYESDYLLSTKTGFIPGQKHTIIWDWLKEMEIADVDDEVNVEESLTENVLYRSPSASRVKITRVSASHSDLFQFKVDLSMIPTSENYPQASALLDGDIESYNIDEVIIYRVDDHSDIKSDMREIIRQKVEEGQTEVTLSIDAVSDREKMFDQSPEGQKYYAFITTNAGISVGEGGDEVKAEYLVAESETQYPVRVTSPGGNFALGTAGPFDAFIEYRLDDGTYIPATELTVFYSDFVGIGEDDILHEIESDHNGKVTIQHTLPLPSESYGMYDIYGRIYVNWTQSVFILGTVDLGDAPDPGNIPF